MEGKSLEDIENYITKMERKNAMQISKASRFTSLSGRKLFELAVLEREKIVLLKKQLKKVELGTIDEQQRFIEEIYSYFLGEEISVKKE